MRLLTTLVLFCFAAVAQQLSTQTTSGKHRVGRVSEPRCDFTPDPQYTEEAKKANVKGTVIASAIVGVEGCLSEIKVIRKRGYGLDEEAVKALRLWHCKPVITNGEPAASKMTVELNFDPKFPSEPAPDVKPCTERMGHNGQQQRSEH